MSKPSSSPEHRQALVWSWRKCFAADGCRLVLVARKGIVLEALAAELRKAHKIQAQVITADLAHPESPTRLLAHLQSAGLKVDVLVNNAGVRRARQVRGAAARAAA